VGLISSPDEDRRWTRTSQMEEMSVLQQYLVSFHWSLAQFAGELIIEPENNTERFFTVTVLFLAIIGSSMFVSSLTTSMTRLQIITSQQSSQLSTLRRFLMDRNISRPLAARVQQNAQYALMEQKKDIPESSVELLAIISHPLLVELHFEIYSQVLLEHHFFQCYNHINPGGVSKVCHTAVKLFTMYQGDVLFTDFEVPSVKRMYFLVSGTINYTQPRRLPLAAGKGQWLSEAILWTHWTHCGTTRAGSTARLLSLDAETFQSVISTFPTSHARHYAEAFVCLMNEFCPDDLSDLDTLMDNLDDLIEEAFPVAEGQENSDEPEEERRSSFSSSSGNLSRKNSMQSELPEDKPCARHERALERVKKVGRGSGRGSGQMNKAPGFSRRSSDGKTQRHIRAAEVAKKLSRISRKNSGGSLRWYEWELYAVLCRRLWRNCCCACWSWARRRFRGEADGNVEPFSHQAVPPCSGPESHAP